MAGQSVYKITTDQGTYNVTVDDGSPGPSVTGGLATSAATGAVPAAARIAEEVATNPAVPKIAAAIGRGVGAVTSLPSGLAGFGSIAKGAWNGSRAGWFTGKLAQDVAAPVASVLEKAAPIAEGASLATFPLAVHDAAALVGAPKNSIGMQRDAAIGQLVSEAVDKAKALIAGGAAPSKAALDASGGNPSIFAAIMSHFMKSGGIK